MRRPFFFVVAIGTLQGQNSATDKPQPDMAQRMTKMTEGLSSGTLRPFGGITCFTCHRGNAKPSRMPRDGWQDLLAKWPAELKLSEEDAKKTSREVYKNIQTAPNAPAGRLPMSMSIYAAALGVTCEYCHVPGRWESDEKPAKRTARTMLGLFDEMPRYFEETHQPIMQCYTCHQGSPHPERQPKG